MSKCFIRSLRNFWKVYSSRQREISSEWENVETLELKAFLSSLDVDVPGFTDFNSNNLFLYFQLIQVKNKIEVPTKFELTSAKYPPLWFSKVKSYNVEVNNMD